MLKQVSAIFLSVFLLSASCSAASPPCEAAAEEQVAQNAHSIKLLDVPATRGHTAELLYGAAGRIAPRASLFMAAEAILILHMPGADSSMETGAQIISVSHMEEIKAQLSQAIASVRQPPIFDISAMPKPADLKIALINLYYSLLSEHPEYKYAYDLQISCSGENMLSCTFSYMPYRTGIYPPGFEGIAVSSLSELIQAARSGLAQNSVPIRITAPNLTVDDMNQALQQVGGSYILCQLNQDATAITFASFGGMTHEACLDRLQTVASLAASVVSERLNSGMTDTEKAAALYTYLTETVRYDHRYYSDRANMPYESQTAYGALYHHLSICGGYAQALQALFEEAGLPCFTVSGRMGSENHMWNIAYLDGRWRYFDATSDRGRAEHGFLYFNVPADQLTRYVWNTDFVQCLTASAV